MKKKPLLTVFASFSGSGGVERMLINLIRGFIALDQPVDLVVVRANSPHLARLPPQVNLIQLHTKHTFSAIPAFARYLRDQRPAVVLAAKDRAGRAAVLARAMAQINTCLVLRLGTNLSAAMAMRTAPERWLRYAPIRLLYPQLDRIIAVSQGVADDTAQIARIPHERISVIRNPVITPELNQLAAEPCPHSWLEPNQPPVILGMGRLQQQKDFPTLIRAFAQVRAERNCRLIILGEGGGRAQLTQLIAELGLNTSVALPGFQVNPYAWLARAGLFALSSAWEGSPNVLTEALALGVPVVATNCPSGPAEILNSGQYGKLVSVGDVAAMANAMVETLKKPLSPVFLRQAVSEYTQEYSAAQYLQALGLNVNTPKE
ncbi:glycosyltransferase [Chromatium okenii]|uniref:glycosyltransferase n=1 Tax=Chromatium okenii TaxID=61644 RepID=UPI0026EDD64C|nr:glycosyltransferase [Chromatium okenii]